MLQKAERKPKTKTVLPLETLAEAWAMAQVHGYPKAGKTYDVHPETIRRAGVKIAANPELRAKVEAKRQEFAEEWRPQCLRVLRAGLESLEDLFDKAKGKPEHLRDVAGAVHLLAEKLIAVDALPNVRRNLQAPNQGQKAATPRGGAASGAVGKPSGEPAGPAGAIHSGNA